MKINIYIAIFCSFIFSQISIAQNTFEKVNQEKKMNDSAALLVTPTHNIEAINFPDSYISIIHQGYYIAKFELSYMQNGIAKTIETGNVVRGFNKSYLLAHNFTDIKLKGWAMTGFMWQPWGEIYSLQLNYSDSKKCYRNTGTSLNRQWDNDCEGK